MCHFWRSDSRRLDFSWSGDEKFVCQDDPKQNCGGQKDDPCKCVPQYKMKAKEGKDKDSDDYTPTKVSYVVLRPPSNNTAGPADWGAAVRWQDIVACTNDCVTCSTGDSAIIPLSKASVLRDSVHGSTAVGQHL